MGIVNDGGPAALTMKDELNMEGLRVALQAIAEGYMIEVFDDRYIRVENPEHRPDNGSDPFFLIDVASLPAASPSLAGEVVVKALEWHEENYEPGWWYAQNDVLNLGYEVRVNSRSVVRVRFPGKTWETFEGAPDAAKAAAQADYERRIRSALTLIPAGKGEALVSTDQHAVENEASPAALSAPSVKQDAGWRDIDDGAPKDGTRIWAINKVMEWPVVVEWRDYKSDFSHEVTKQWVCVSDPHERWMPLTGKMVCPSHWQMLPDRLPTPPQPGEGVR